jgi:hypothetical protein
MKKKRKAPRNTRYQRLEDRLLRMQGELRQGRMEAAGIKDALYDARQCIRALEVRDQLMGREKLTALNVQCGDHANRIRAIEEALKKRARK